MSCCARCDLEHEVARLSRSRLLRTGGCAVYRGLVGRDWIDGMVDEAWRGARRGDHVVAGRDIEQVRGGAPARAIDCVDGGPLQDALFNDAALRAFIESAIGLPVRPCGMRASYSIYQGPGAHLDIHRDVVGCDLALVTCLHDDRPDAGGGAVDLWFDDLTTPLDVIRASPDRGRSRVALVPGDSMLVHGGIVPHRIPPPGIERLRIVSLMCLAIVA